MARRKIYTLIFTIVLLSWGGAQAQEFDFGEGESLFKWGAEIPMGEGEKSDFKLRLGTRLQTQVEDVSKEAFGGGKAPSNQDFFVRRARLQVEAKFQENLSYYMDIRADKVDKGDSGVNSFALGDAFFQVKNLFGSEALKMRLFRAKYDISRTQTVSSSRLLVLNRASISDFSADYISNARRGTNLQFLANWNNIVSGQLIVGDSIHESTFEDSRESSGATISSQNLAYGARVRISPIPGWEEPKMTETFFGKGQHFTLGAGYYGVSNVNFLASARNHEVDRSVQNYELNMHYGPFSLMGEYFVFDGMIDDFGSVAFQEGKSEGWYVQSEYVLTGLHFLAPFVRYQDWNRFKSINNYTEKTTMGGINYYIKGNKLRLGLFYEKSEFGDGFNGIAGFSKTKATIAMSLMMHY